MVAAKKRPVELITALTAGASGAKSVTRKNKSQIVAWPMGPCNIWSPECGTTA